MKKLSAIFMMLLLVGTSLGGFQVFATYGVPNFTIVAATATTTGTTIDAKTTSRNGCSPSFPTTDYSLGNDRYVEYLVNVEEAGRYRISSSLKPVKAANYMKVYVNECLAGSSSAFGVDSWTLGNYNLYEVDLLKGINEIRFVSTTVSGSAIYLFNFSFLKIGEATTITRRLANYDNKLINKTINIYNPKDLSYPELNTTYGSSSMAMSAGAWTEYNIDIPSEGKYHLSMNVGSANSDVTFSLNGIQAIIKNISTGGSSSAYRQLIDIGDLMLTTGENTLRIATTADISFTTMMLTSVTITKAANNYDSKSGTGVTDFESYIRLDNQSGWTQYNVDLPFAGNYQISVEASTINDSAFINVLLDNFDMGTYSIPNTQIFSNITLCTLSLNSDGNSIQFSVPEDKAIDIKSFKLERISELPLNDEKIIGAFLNKINNTTVVENILPILEVYSKYLTNNYADNLKSLFYPNFICAYLMGKQFTTIDAFNNQFNLLYQRELLMPTVSLIKNNIVINKLEAGNLTLKISNAIKKNVVVIAAIYDGTLLKYLQSNVTSNEITQLFFNNVEENNNLTFKLFFLDNLSDMQPCELNNLYESNNRIFVTANGNDFGSGTIESPFQTINRAKAEVALLTNEMNEDIIVEIQQGYYPLEEKLTFTTADSGRNGHNVIYRGAQASHRPVISGGEIVNGWSSLGDGRWKASINNINDVRQLYVGGYMAQRARSKYTYHGTNYYRDTNTTYDPDGIKISSINFPDILHPENTELVYNILWTNQRVPVQNIIQDGAQKIILMDQPYYNWQLSKNYVTTSPTLGQEFYIENALEFLDEPGEFYFDKAQKEIYYYPFVSEDMNSVETYVGKTELMVSVKGNSLTDKVSNLIFENLDFRYGTWLEANTQGVAVHQSDCIVNTSNQSPGTTGRTLPAQFQIDYADGISVKNCSFINLGSSAMSMTKGVTNSVAEGNLVRDISGSGIVVGDWNFVSGDTKDKTCKNIQIKNNVVRRNGLEFYSSPAISVYYANNIDVIHNDIKDTPYTGITVGWGWGANMVECQNQTIANNRIENISRVLNDGGHIYTLGKMDNTIISNNYLINSSDFGGIYFDSGSGNITATQNVVSNCQYWLYAPQPDYQNLTVTQNYSNSAGWRNSVSSTSCNIQQADIAIDGNWQAGALDVINNAGVLSSYSSLLTNTEVPAERYQSIFNVPHNEYVSPYTINMRAVNYMQGGEGIGYHKVIAGAIPKEFIQGGETVIGDIRQSEWLKYQVEANNCQTYSLRLIYSTPETNPRVNVYVNGIIQLQGVELLKTQSWSDYYTYTVGNLDLLQGLNEIKIVFAYYGFSFKGFSLRDINATGTDPEYDDGKYIYE